MKILLLMFIGVMSAFPVESCQGDWTCWAEHKKNYDDLRDARVCCTHAIPRITIRWMINHNPLRNLTVVTCIKFFNIMFPSTAMSSKRSLTFKFSGTEHVKFES